jgi:hypothetical protein
MSSRFTSSIALALMLAAAPALAKEPTTTRSARAQVLAREGQALLDSGNVEAACFKFEASETLHNDVGTLLHLGDCYEREQRSASAYHTFLQAQAVARLEKDAEREQDAAARVVTLEPKLTRVVFYVPMTSRVPGLTVRLGANPVPAESWGTSIPVDPGVQSVSASAPGYIPWSDRLNTLDSEGAKLRVNVPALNPTLVVDNSRRNAFRTAGIVTGSVGLAGIGAGAVFNALAHSADDARACTQGVLQCNQNRNGYSNAAAVSFAVGTTLVATGVTLFVLAPAPDKQERHALRVAARIAGAGGRLQLEGVW